MTDIITVYKQNSIRILTPLGAVYIDPFEMTEAPHDAAFILITHDHFDHFSPESIEKVTRPKTVLGAAETNEKAANLATVLVVPEKMAKKAEEVSEFVGKTVLVEPGKSYETDGLEFETVAAYNLLKPFHPKSAGWVGYIVKTGEKRIYIAGDTDATKEAKSVKCDVALVPAGGTYTMDAKKAAELVNDIRPEAAIPVHYGSVVGSPADGETFAALVKAPVKAELKIKF